MGSESEELVTLAEAAAILRVSYFKAHSMLLLGKLEGVRKGHRWLVKTGSIERHGHVQPASEK